jgi:predicted RNA-binding protein YlqC (UPF0109 family)
MSKKENQEMDFVKDLLDHILECLVDHPESLGVDYFIGTNNVTIEVKCDSKDFGKLLGKKGRTADAIRTILGAMISRLGKRFTFDLVDPKNT